MQDILRLESLSVPRFTARYSQASGDTYIQSNLSFFYLSFDFKIPVCKYRSVRWCNTDSIMLRYGQCVPEAFNLLETPSTPFARHFSFPRAFPVSANTARYFCHELALKTLDIPREYFGIWFVDETRRAQKNSSSRWRLKSHIIFVSNDRKCKAAFIVE